MIATMLRKVPDLIASSDVLEPLQCRILQYAKRQSPQRRMDILCDAGNASAGEVVHDLLQVGLATVERDCSHRIGKRRQNFVPCVFVSGYLTAGALGASGRLGKVQAACRRASLVGFRIALACWPSQNENCVSFFGVRRARTQSRKVAKLMRFAKRRPSVSQ